MVVPLCGRGILSKRSSSFLKIPKRHRYIVLVPEIREDLPWVNPLLKEDKTPVFNDITMRKCVASTSMQAVIFEETVKNLGEKLERNKNVDLFKDILNPVENMHQDLEATWNIAKTLFFARHSVMPSEYYIDLHARTKKALASRYINVPLYKACKDVMSEKSSQLNDQQKRVLYKYILEGRLNGLGLNEKEKSRYAYFANLELCSTLEFRYKLKVSTNLYKQTIQNSEVMRDFPQDFLTMTAQDPEKPHAGPWNVTLEPHILNMFLEYCPDRGLRYKAWEANVSRSSLRGEPALRTSVTLEQLREYRKDKAQVLGYETYAHMRLETKMAGKIENIYSMMDKLLQTAFPAQKREIRELQTFAKQRGLQGSLQFWDIPYFRRKHQFSLYNYDEDAMRKYFPLSKVLSGLFKFVETMFDVRIETSKEKLDAWHPDVLTFDMFDLRGSASEPMAKFYFDPYAREPEKIRKAAGGGWSIPLKSRSIASGTKPLTALIFNFRTPTKETPSLLTFSEVKGLFQEFGYMLQHSLTTLDYPEISGHSFLEWDAEFIANHFMANWLYEPWVIQEISGHYETGEPLPMEMIETLKNVKFHFAGYDLCRELYLSRLDIELHTKEDFWMKIMTRIWKDHFVMKPHDDDFHVCSFDTIFGGEWGAAYYSFLWSEMVAADLYEAFHETSYQDQQQHKEIGARFRDSFLSLAGCYPASEIFRRFRGRDPSPKALLKSLGLHEHTKESTNELDEKI